MKYYKGYIFGVCETLGRLTGLDAWIFRVLAIIFFSDIVGVYLITALLFSMLLENSNEDDEENVEKKEKKEKKKQKALQKKQENPLDDLKDLSEKESVRMRGKTILKD